MPELNYKSKLLEIEQITNGNQENQSNWKNICTKNLNFTQNEPFDFNLTTP